MSKIIQLLNDKHLLSEDETLVLAEGLDNAVIGITTNEPKQVVYNYWKCVDGLMRIQEIDEPVSFDEALLFLDEYIDEITELSNYAPIFIKTI